MIKLSCPLCDTPFSFSPYGESVECPSCGLPCEIHEEGEWSSITGEDEREWWLEPREEQRAYRERLKKVRSEDVQTVKGYSPSHRIQSIGGTDRWKALVDAAWLLLKTVKSEMEGYASSWPDVVQWPDALQRSGMRARLEGIKAALASLDKIEREYGLEPQEEQQEQRVYREHLNKVHRGRRYRGGWFGGDERWRSMVDTAWLHLETARSEMEGFAGERSDASQQSDGAEEHRARLEGIKAALASLDHEFMTPSEVLALGTKLQLIWVVNTPSGAGSREPGSVFWRYDGGGFDFKAKITNRISFFFYERWQGCENIYTLRLDDTWYQSFAGYTGSLVCSQTDPVVRPSYYAGELEKMERFTTEWTPLMRRNCWLSGLQLECSATERMEWARYGRDLGLSEEELKELLTW